MQPKQTFFKFVTYIYLQVDECLCMYSLILYDSFSILSFSCWEKKKMSDTTCHRSGDRSTNPIQFTVSVCSW